MVNRKVTQPCILWGCTSIHQTNRKGRLWARPSGALKFLCQAFPSRGCLQNTLFQFRQGHMHIHCSRQFGGSPRQQFNVVDHHNDLGCWAVRFPTSVSTNCPSFSPENRPPGLVQPHSPRSGNDPFGWLLPRGPRGLSSFHLRRLWCPG